MNKLTMISEKNQYGIMLIVVGLIFILLQSCHGKDRYVAETFEINGGWGYCILKNNKIIIKQTHIPTIPERIRFKSQEDANKVGQLVLERIKNNLPPTITKNDLFLLKINIE